jgi:hypothetical protein
MNELRTRGVGDILIASRVPHAASSLRNRPWSPVAQQKAA